MGRAYGDLTAVDKVRLDRCEPLTSKRDRNPAGRFWMLRINVTEEWDEHDKDGQIIPGTHHVQPELNEPELAGIFDEKNWSWVGSLEEGSETHRRHFQIFMVSDTSVRLSTINNLFLKTHGIHVGYIEPMRSSVKSCLAYVTKSKTHVDGPWIHGDYDFSAEPEQGKRTDLVKLRRAIEDGMSVNDILRDDELSLLASRNLAWLDRMWTARQEALYGMNGEDIDRELKVHYLWGKPRIGKTYHVLHLYSPDEIFYVSQYKTPFDDYAGQRVLVLDEFKSQLGLQEMNGLLDRYKGVKLHARYHDALAAYEEVWVISNFSIRDQYADATEDERSAFEGRFDTIEWMDFDRRIYDDSDPWDDGQDKAKRWKLEQARLARQGNPDEGKPYGLLSFL